MKWVAATVCVAALAGCAAPAPTPGAAASVATSAPATSTSSFEQQYRDRASSAQRQGHLADAAIAWEVLTVLRPDSREYRDALVDTRRQIGAAVAERLPRAAQAQRRGDLEAATQGYLAVLALQPDSTPAADALRSIERERVKRQQLGRLSRLALMRRATETVGSNDKAVAPAGLDRNELEHATILARQGEIDSAIALLERRLAADRNDRAARNLLADLYERKADDVLAARDTAGAIALLEKSLRLDPSDVRVAERLKQLRAAATSKPSEAKSR
jgi:tetratricopeptide (TPR) repeat protein